MYLGRMNPNAANIEDFVDNSCILIISYILDQLFYLCGKRDCIGLAIQQKFASCVNRFLPHLSRHQALVFTSSWTGGASKTQA